MRTKVSTKGFKYPHIIIRLSILGLGIGDLADAINERMSAENRPHINYVCVSKALHGKYVGRMSEIIGVADSITYQWVREYADEYLRVIKPRLAEYGLHTNGMTARLHINGLQRPEIWVQDYIGRAVAIYDVTEDYITYTGE